MADKFIEDRKAEVANNKILLYIKGTKEQPMCGFSAAVVQIFNGLGKPFKTVDILANPDIRARLSELTNWPTFPQVFINGKFIGGCDIVSEMNEAGELVPIVEEAFKK